MVARTCGAVIATVVRRLIATGVVVGLLAVTSCSLWEKPDSESRRSYDPIVELFVVNSLAETLTAIELDGSGRFLGTQEDAAVLGSVPNAILAAGSELVVTLSGENALLRLDESSFVVTGRIDVGAGVNPMVTAAVRPSLFATTGLFSGRVHLYDRDGFTAVDGGGATVAPLSGFAGLRAPQGVVAIAAPAGGGDEVRVLVANTAYSSARDPDFPYGRATLTVFRLAVAADAGTASGAPLVSLIESRTYELEAAGDRSAIDGESAAGLNPQQIIDLPGTDEIVVIGAGINYGSGGGADDGVVLVLDRSALIDGAGLPAAATDIVEQRVSIGGSPGAGTVLQRDDGGYTLLTAGTTAVRAIQRPDAAAATPWSDPASTNAAVLYEATGGLPFLSDVTAWNDVVYVSDFGNDRVLRFTYDGAGGIVYRDARGVSDGPIALLVGVE